MFAPWRVMSALFVKAEKYLCLKEQLRRRHRHRVKWGAMTVPQHKGFSNHGV